MEGARLPCLLLTYRKQDHVIKNINIVLFSTKLVTYRRLQNPCGSATFPDFFDSKFEFLRTHGS
jgi:hypothetical protein